MKRLTKITGSAVFAVSVVLSSLSGVAYGAGGNVRGAQSNGHAGWWEDAVDPAYTRLDEDPADEEAGFKAPVHVVVPAKRKVQLVGPKFGPTKIRPTKTGRK